MAVTNSLVTKRPYALWVVQVLLALVFLFAGGGKLIMSDADLTADFPMPALFMRFIGVCEILGAFGLILPGAFRIRRFLTPLAAAGLVIIMTGATVLTLADGNAEAVVPFVLGVLAALVVYGRRDWLAVERPGPRHRGTVFTSTSHAR